MKIIRVLNNSAVISENQDHEEIIALGKGIAYGKKVGRMSLINKKYIKFSHPCLTIKENCY